MPRTSWDRAFELSPRSPQRLAGASESAGEDILTALRGFCLFISNIHTAGISATESSHILYPALSRDDLLNIYG